MKTARHISRFLRTEAYRLQRRCYGDALILFAVSLGTQLLQAAIYSVLLILAVGLDPQPVATALGLTAFLMALQIAAFAVCRTFHDDSLRASPVFRIAFAGYFLVGPQTFMDAVHALKKAWRIGSIDFENCGRVIYVMMQEADETSWRQAWQAVDVRQDNTAISEHLRLFPGVIVRPTYLRLTRQMRIEIADFCAREKERIGDALTVAKELQRHDMSL